MDGEKRRQILDPGNPHDVIYFVTSVSAAGYVENVKSATKFHCVLLLAVQTDAGSLLECPFTDFRRSLNRTRGGPLQFVAKTFLRITGRVHAFIMFSAFCGW